jgi:hypothetical protein
MQPHNAFLIPHVKSYHIIPVLTWGLTLRPCPPSASAVTGVYTRADTTILARGGTLCKAQAGTITRSVYTPCLLR